MSPDGDGPPTSIEEAFDLHGRYVAGVAYRLLGRDEEIDDVVQEVFLELLQRLDEVRSNAALRRWLATVTVRRVAQRIRKRKSLRRVGVFGGDPPDYDDVAGDGASPADRALLRRVYAELDGLPVKERMAWTLRHVHRERMDDVARLCDCSLATAKRRVDAAHQKLQKRLGLDRSGRPFRHG